MASNLNVKITADEADLTARMAVATAETRKFNAELRTTAAAVAEAGSAADETLKNGLLAAAEAAAVARKEVAALRAEINEAGGGIAGMKGAIEDLTAPITAFTGLIGVASEALLVGFGAEKIKEVFEGAIEEANRFNVEVLKLSTAMGSSLEDASVLAAGLKLVGSSSDEYGGMLLKLERQIKTNEVAVNALGIATRDSSGHLLDATTLMHNAVSGLEEFKDGTDRNQASLYVFGRSAQEAFNIFRLNEEVMKRAKEVVDQYGGAVTTEGIEKTEKFEIATGVLGVAFDTLKRKIGADLIPSMTASASALTDELAPAFHTVDAIMKGFILTVDALIQGEVVLFQVFAQVSNTIGTGIVGLAKAFDDLGHLRFTEAANDISTSASTVKGAWTATFADISSKMETWNARRKALFDEPEGKGGSTIPGGNKNFVDPPNKGDQASELTTFRSNLAQMEANWDGTHTAMLAEAVKMWEEELATAKLTSKEEIEAETGLAQAKKALRQADATEQQAIARSNSTADIAIGRQGLEARKQILQAEFAAKQISAADEYNELRDLAAAEEALDEKTLQEELAGLQNEPAKYAEVYNQIRVLKAKLVTDLATMDKQQQINAQKAAEQESGTWKAVTSAIGSAESTLIQSVIGGRTTMSQALLQLSSQLVTRELADDARYYSTKLLYSALNISSENTLEQGGIIAHALAETSKTAATGAGTTTRAAAEETENTSFISRLPSIIGGWLGVETAKTGATVAGVTTRTAVEEVGEQEGASMQAAAGSKSIMNDAYEAAAGAYKSAAQIPFVGWILAPIAGAAAFAAVAAYDVVSAEGGMWQVPADGTMIAAHAQESVLPAGVAGPMRDFFSDGGASQGQGQGGGGGDQYHLTFTIQAIDTQTGAQFLRDNSGLIANQLVNEIRNGNPAMRKALTS